MIISICFGLTPPPTAAQEQGAKNGTAPASMKLEAAGASMAEANNGSNPPIMLELEQKGKVKPQVASAQSSFSDGATTNGANALPSKVMLKGQVTYLVPKGTGLKLKLATVPTSGLRLMNRDDDGNLYPARQGQEITAKTTEDLYVDDNKVIPGGTVFHGMVSQIIPPKRVGRPGSLVITFDRFTTPNGKSFAFRCEANNYKPSTPKSKMKGLGYVASYTAGGALTGALIAYQYFGLDKTIAMHGYNIAGGAAAGALLATGYALWKKGPHAVLEPGDDLNMSIDCDMLLPAAVEPGPKKAPNNLPGLEVEILKSKVVKDGLDGHNLRIEMLVTNDTDVRLKSIDLYLKDDNGSEFPVVSGDQDDEEFLFDVDPHSVKRISLDFQMEYPKLKRKMIWYDHQSRRKIFEGPLP